MRDYENGWSGLKAFALSHKVIEQGDSDDVAANKIKAVIQGTLPEEQTVESAEGPSGEGPGLIAGLVDRVKGGDGA